MGHLQSLPLDELSCIFRHSHAMALARLAFTSKGWAAKVGVALADFYPVIEGTPWDHGTLRADRAHTVMLWQRYEDAVEL